MLEELNLKLDTWMQTDDYKCQLKKQDKYFKSLREFLAIFTKDKIESMNIDEYVTGKKNQKAFCYWLEETLEFYGSISGRTTAYEKFVIYWDKEIKDYSFGPKKWKSRKGFGSTKDEIFENIKKSILDVVDATKNNDYERIINNPLNPQFKNKINFLYDYDNQIPIYSNEDLNVILTLFEIPFDKNIDRIYKREKLFEFYKNNGYDQKVSPALFMLFIYSWYGYRAILRTNEKPTIESKEIEGYCENNTYKMGANSIEYRNNYIENFTNSFNKHLSQIEKYKDDCMKKLKLLPNKIVISFVCEDKTLGGTYYKENNKMGKCVNPLATKQFINLLKKSSIDYLIFNSQNDPSQLTVLSKNSINDNLLKKSKDLDDKEFYIIPAFPKFTFFKYYDKK